MLKSEVGEFLGLFQTGNKKKDRTNVNRVVWKLPQSVDAIPDQVSSAVWWVLTWVPKNKESLNRGHKTSAARFATTNFTPPDLKSILQHPQHIRNIIKKLFEEMSDSILFEHFLVDFLSRNTDHNGMNYVLKWNRTLDNILATDFTFSLNDSDGKSIKVWTQLTTRDYEKRWLKKEKMTKLRDKLESWQVDDLMNGMSARITPDLLTLVSVNWKIRESLHGWGTPFREAYKKWSDNGYPTWWPSVFLDEDIQNVFVLMNHFLPIMTQYFHAWSPTHFESTTDQDIVFWGKNYLLKFSYEKNMDISSVLIFDNEEWREKFIFSLDFTWSRYGWV
ncbi:MAG: hypothetical protein ACD_71C00233G0007 [uncultured bacterium (gcode 4)]|uniref:Uncharacterized protein n=1 Tax=uncultured bacterium (gcode 4) TaxID=1234023 RepID=K1YMC7_9BACT|nr:MAG: hypothetical protein ACD_71C00233G0007 [uncultured bacterium (gcode 4)]